MKARVEECEGLYLATLWKSLPLILRILDTEPGGDLVAAIGRLNFRLDLNEKAHQTSRRWKAIIVNQRSCTVAQCREYACGLMISALPPYGRVSFHLPARKGKAITRTFYTHTSGESSILCPSQRQKYDEMTWGSTKRVSGRRMFECRTMDGFITHRGGDFPDLDVGTLKCQRLPNAWTFLRMA